MPARQLKHDNYTVAWVCALSIELTAAQRMLDEEHTELEKDGSDMNIYTLGRVAAVVAMQMKSTFKSIRFGLMVGIGGGVPSNKAADVRLGDVVVSKPNQFHGGVVQYDFGKTIPDGFERTGFLNSPPRLLLSAVGKLHSNAYLGRSKLREYLSKLDSIPAFARNAAGPDILYEAMYNHEGDDTCGNCKEDWQVVRPRRNEDVKVHFGTIASGNRVMRDGIQRDKVSMDLGGVLCFEMEAAGLMNSFPCLVVRGICDYADSHKNKKWQAYAAGTAAACAKELLSIIPPVEMSNAGTMKKLVKSESGVHVLNRAAVIERLSTLADMRSQKLNYKHSIKDLLLLLNLDSSEDYRELLADHLGIHQGSSGNPSRNIPLYDAMIEQLCKNGGEVPDDIRRIRVAIPT